MSQQLVYKYRPRIIEDISYMNIYPIIKSILKQKSKLRFLFKGDIGVGKTILIDVLRNELAKKYKIFTLAEYLNKKDFVFDKTNSVILIDNLDYLHIKNQLGIKKILENSDINLIGTINNHNKVNENIIMRLLLFKINTPSIKHNLVILNNIKDKELIQISDDDLNTIASDNSITIGDKINILQKFYYTNGKYTLNDLNIGIQVQKWKYFHKICKERENKEIKYFLKQIIDYGYSSIDFLYQYLNYIKIQNTINDVKKFKIIKLIISYIKEYYKIKEMNCFLFFFSNKLSSILNEPDI